MALMKILRIMAFVSVLLFLSLFFLSLARSGEGLWHDRLAELWQKQQWHDIRSLAENLYQAGKADAECLFLAMLASQQIQNPPGTQLFAERLLSLKILNWKMEVEAAGLDRKSGG